MAKIVGLTFPKPADPPKLYTCPHCGKEYKTEDGLANHIKEKHPGDEPTETGEPRE